MSYQEGSAYCPTCVRNVLVRRPEPNHLLHLALTIFLCGSWAILWVLFCIFREPWRCAYCGSAGVRGGSTTTDLWVYAAVAALGLAVLGALVAVVWLANR